MLQIKNQLNPDKFDHTGKVLTSRKNISRFFPKSVYRQNFFCIFSMYHLSKFPIPQKLCEPKKLLKIVFTLFFQAGELSLDTWRTNFLSLLQSHVNSYFSPSIFIRVEIHDNNFDDKGDPLPAPPYL